MNQRPASTERTMSVEASALSQFRTLALIIETKHLDYIRQRGSVL